MKRRSLLLATPPLILAAPALAQAPAAMVDEVKKRGVLRSGLSTFVPWAMRDKNGGLIGFELDVARRLAEGRPLSPDEAAEGFACFGTEDYRIGRDAFLAKDKPVFKGK